MRRLAEIREIIESITGRFGEVFSAKLISPRVRFTKYPRKYLGPLSRRAPRFELIESADPFNLDSTSEVILGFLAEGKLRSQRQIARACCCPFATVERRINQLESEAVLVGYYWDLPVEDLGRSACQLLLECGGSSEMLSREMREFCDYHQCVTFLGECIGVCEFEIGAEVSDPRELGALIDELHERFGSRLHNIRVLTEIEDKKLIHYSAGGSQSEKG